MASVASLKSSVNSLVKKGEGALSFPKALELHQVKQRLRNRIRRELRQRTKLEGKLVQKRVDLSGKGLSISDVKKIKDPIGKLEARRRRKALIKEIRGTLVEANPRLDELRQIKSVLADFQPLAAYREARAVLDAKKKAQKV